MDAQQETKKGFSDVVRVMAFDREFEEPVRNRVVDLRREKNRIWLEKFIVWATTNHKSVEIINIEDDKD